MNLIISLIKLSRPSNVCIAFLTIFVAAEIAGGLDPINNVILAAISAALITIGANVINDYFDIEIDKINKPHRPLAAGRISKKTALYYFVTVFFVAWFLAFNINYSMFLIAFIVGILLFFYSFRFKRTIIWGNLLVSSVIAMAFVYGGGAVNNYTETLIPSAFAFFFTFGREILKDIQDIKGDQKEGAITFPIKYGVKKSLKLIYVVFILLVIITVIPYIFNIYGIKYFLTICFGVYPVLLYAAYWSWMNTTSKSLGIISNLLKADMIIGLLAIYLN